MIVALIGLGHWGSRLVPKLLDHDSIDSCYCYDVDAARSMNIGREFPSVRVASDYENILNNPEIEAVIIATPVLAHYSLAKKALESGKHVLLEKPLTNCTEEARHLVDLASARRLKLMVDHITVYSGAAQRIKQVVDEQTLGKVLYLSAVRQHLGQIQSDVSVVWDLAIHEFALIDYLLGDMPSEVSATGAAFYGSLEEIADVTLYYRSGIVAHVHVSWLAPLKTRQLIIAGMEKMLLFDDAVADNKLQLFDRGVDLSIIPGADKPVITYRNRGCQVLDHVQTEPLVAVIDEFVKSINEGREPLTNGEVGLRCVRVLQAAEESVREKGKSVNLE